MAESILKECKLVVSDGSGNILLEVMEGTYAECKSCIQVAFEDGMAQLLPDGEELSIMSIPTGRFLSYIIG